MRKKIIIFSIITMFIIALGFYMYKFSYKNLTDILEIKVNNSSVLSIAKAEGLLKMNYINDLDTKCKNELLELINKLKVKPSFIGINNIRFENSKYYSLNLFESNKNLLINFFSDNYIFISQNGGVLLKVSSEINIFDEIDQLYQKCKI